MDLTIISLSANLYLEIFSHQFKQTRLEKMKVIGMIGGTSWESTKEYYEIINKKVNEILGGNHSGKCLLYSVDFAEIVELSLKENWKVIDKIMVESAKRLEKGGADFIIICANTLHLCTKAINEIISLPLLHIAEATGAEIKKKNLKKVGLIGTKFTMEKDFYKDILNKKFGIEVLVPNHEDRNIINNIIYQELVNGKILDESRQKYVEIINKLEKNGAKGVILGCTEIPLLISDNDVRIPTFDTTRIHAEKAVEYALEK